MAELDTPPSLPVSAGPPLTKTLLWTLTITAGVAVANIYYNQPMLADMMRTFHTNPHTIGLVATFTQIGYALGMPAFIPLADLFDRRELLIVLLFAVSIALVGAALAPSVPLLILASFFIGFTSIVPQVIIPLASDLANPGEQGHTIGTVLSGVLLGILLARTVSGVVGQHFGWRVMFWAAAIFCLALAVLLRAELPSVPPRGNVRYFELIRSLLHLPLEIPKLPQVSATAAMFFASFSAFWTTLVFLLETPPYHYGAQAAGLFGIVGATGVLIAPVAGRYSDRRGPRFVVAIAIVAVLLAFAVFWRFGFHLAGLVIGVILLDGGVQGAQVANQSRVLGLRPEARNRINTIYMIAYFGGGSLGSLFGSYAWAHWHWTGVCFTGLVFMLIAGLIFLPRGSKAVGEMEM